MKFTLTEYLNASSTFKYKLRDIPQYSLSELLELLIKVNIVRRECGIPFIATSGFRSSEHNKFIGGSRHSAHSSCQAVDLKDVDGRIYNFLKNNPKLMEELDLYVEDRAYTPTWCHISTRPTIERH